MDAERRGEVVDFSVMNNFIKFMNSIEINYMETIYTTELEDLTIERSKAFYKSIIQDILSNKPYIQYLNWGVNIINTEELRLGNYLPPMTIKKILNCLKEIIFYNQSKILLESSTGFKDILLSQNMNVYMFIYT